jgi:hypothetical protein
MFSLRSQQITFSRRRYLSFSQIITQIESRKIRKTSEIRKSEKMRKTKEINKKLKMIEKINEK